MYFSYSITNDFKKAMILKEVKTKMQADFKFAHNRLMIGKC